MIENLATLAVQYSAGYWVGVLIIIIYLFITKG